MVAEPRIGQTWTVAQYLEMERGSALRHEFVGGRVYAMGGGSQRHSRMSIDICAILAAHLDADSPGRCQAFNADMRIRLANELDHVYADASVSCDERDLADDSADFIRYPSLVVEVLSPSTQPYDRHAKFDLYRQRDTLLEYLLVATARQSVEVRTRVEAGTWRTLSYGPADQVVLTSVGLVVPVAELYRGIRHDQWADTSP